MKDSGCALTVFMKRLLSDGSPIGRIPFGPRTSWNIQDVTSVLWQREPPFQVQLFIVPPHYIIPEHVHPNVDSYEVYLGGHIRFSHSGKWTISYASLMEADEDGLSVMRGRTLRVRPNDVHGGIFGPSGGVFMSVQHWLNGVDPHDVAADYSGVVMGNDHMGKVVYGEAIVKPHLTARDAASLEEFTADW